MEQVTKLRRLVRSDLKTGASCRRKSAVISVDLSAVDDSIHRLTSGSASGSIFTFFARFGCVPGGVT